MTIAPTRTGKGVGTIIPNLLEYPFGVTGLSSAAFNPLDRIDPHGLDLADDCMTLADALVHDAPGEAGDAHWNEEAKALIAGILLHIVDPRHGPWTRCATD